MSFRRADVGLTNYNLFLKCDFVVFVEGGSKSLSLHEAMSGDYCEVSLDIHYWKKLFELYKVKMKFEFRSVGSKTTVKSIAEGIVSGNIENVIAAMDQDLDLHIGSKMYSSPFVLYTFGYSWENDIWNERSVIDVFASLYPATSVPEDLDAYVTDGFAAFRRHSRRIIRADIVLAQNGDTLIPRNSGEELITTSKGRPEFNRSRALDLLTRKNKAKKRKYLSDKQLTDISTNHCYGKVVGSFGYRSLMTLLNRYNITNSLPKAVVSTLVINKLSLETWSEDIRLHYDAQMGMLQNAL